MGSERTCNKINALRAMLLLTLERLQNKDFSPIWSQLDTDRQQLQFAIKQLEDEIED